MILAVAHRRGHPASCWRSPPAAPRCGCCASTSAASSSASAGCAERGPGPRPAAPARRPHGARDLRTVTLNVPPQDVITRDNVPARVTAVAYYRVIDPTALGRRDRERPARDLADRADDAALGARQGRPRRAAGRARAAQRAPAADHRRPDRAVGRQGHDRRDQGRRDPRGMQHAMARQAEAERERRAKVINAEGEFQAAARLTDAADVISRNPVDAAAALPADADRDRPTRTRRSSSRCRSTSSSRSCSPSRTATRAAIALASATACVPPSARPGCPTPETSGSSASPTTPATCRRERKTTRPGRRCP